MFKPFITSTAIMLSLAPSARTEAPTANPSPAQDAAVRASDDGPRPVDEDDHLEWDSGVPVGPIDPAQSNPST